MTKLTDSSILIPVRDKGITMKKPVDVYLAGGMKSCWQDRVKAALRKLKERGLVRWSDPRANMTKNPDEYELLDIMRVESADIIFGYAEDDNPGLFALCVEIGHGHAQGKRVILVNELSEQTDPKRKRYFSFVRADCDYVTEKWHDGINMLEKMILALAED